MQVSWAWQNKAKGTVTWTFTNNSRQQQSAILLRNNYYFGDAFYEIYANNGYSFEEGPPVSWTGQPPLAVIGFPQPDGTTNFLVAFVFTLDGGKSLTWPEAGFTGGVQPTAPQTFTVTYEAVSPWCISYDPTLPAKYDKQTGSTAQPFKPDPAAFSVALFSAPATAPWLPWDGQNVATRLLKLVSIMAPPDGGSWWYWGVAPENVGGLLDENHAVLVQAAPYWDTDATLNLVVIMRSDAPPGWWYWGVRPADLNALLTEHNAQLIQALPYWDTDGTLKLVVIMVPDTQQWWWQADVKPADLNALLHEHNAQLVQAAPYWDTDDTLKLVVIMVPDTQQWWWQADVKPADLNALLHEHNARLVQAAPYWDTDGTLKLVVIMVADTQQRWWYWGYDPDGTGRLLQATAGGAQLVQALPYLGCGSQQLLASTIQFVIETGNDDAGGGLNGSTQTADVLLHNGKSFTVTLRNSGDPNWDNWSTHTVSVSVPIEVGLYPSQPNGIAGIRLNLVQGNPSWSADNWDVASLAVTLLNEPQDPVLSPCQLRLVGHQQLQDGSTGLVRLSQSAGSSGNGPSSPVYTTGHGSGCP